VNTFSLPFFSPLIASLREITGPDHTLTHGDLSAWQQDCRGRTAGVALAVVRPAHTDQVARVVRVCALFLAQHPGCGLGIVPQGGNTGLVQGSTPDGSGRQIVLSLQRLNAVRHVDTANLTMTLEAGCILQTAQECADQAGLLFALSLAAKGSCTVGGNLATNAGGTQVLRYGNARDLCLGLEVVTASGDIWHGLRGLRKDNTGYDLRDLLVGSEGTLGIITAATFKLYPRPASQLCAWGVVPSLPAAVRLLGLAHQQLGAGLTGFELMGQLALGLVARHFADLNVPLWQDGPYCVLLAYSDHRPESVALGVLLECLESALADGCLSNAVMANSLAQAETFWRIRESLPAAQTREGQNIKHDIALPVSQVAQFVQTTDQRLQQTIAGLRLVTFGHLGDGNLHYNVQAPVGVDACQFVLDHEETINRIVFDAVMALGGSFSAEHGIGSLRVLQLQRYQSPVALGMMQAIKKALDPLHLLNPGRVLLSSHSSYSSYSFYL